MSRPLHHTTSLCATCKRSVEARLVEDDEQIWMEKRCEQHGAERVLISSNASWYHETMAATPELTPPPGAHEVNRGCPFDCGPCTSHQQRLHLPVVPITSACNLDCPICYTHNRNDDAYHMSLAELDGILDNAAKLAPDRRIINITGGEPTIHPQFLQVVERCVEKGLHRVTVSTHGLTLLGRPALVKRLAELDVRVILSFDSFSEATNEAMLGGQIASGKIKVLELLEEHSVNTTLLPVIAEKLNAHEAGRIIRTALNMTCVRSVEFHPMTFTGENGVSFDRRTRTTTFDTLSSIERTTNGVLSVGDFVPHPLAHSLCYQVAYLLRTQDGWVPFTRFMKRETLRELLCEGLYIEPSTRTEQILQDVINNLWASQAHPEALDALNRLVRELSDSERSLSEPLRASELATKAVYVHTHMDEETFDSDRIRACPVGMPDGQGGNIPSCAYNTLYRSRDNRFTKSPEASLVTLGRGRVRHPESLPL